MTLLAQSFVPACRLEPLRDPDGLGGENLRWREGEAFEAAFALLRAAEATVADQTGLRRRFSILTRQGVALRRGDRVKRLSDGLVLRLVSDPADARTPASSGLRLQQADGEVIDP